jgi:hypothetical protein
MLNSLIDILVKVAAGALATLLLAATPPLLRLIRERVKNTTAREALAFITAATAAEVAARAAKVRDLKDPLRPGEWNSATAARELSSVIDAVKSSAPGQVAVLQRGLAEGQTLDAMLRSMAEAQVEVLRRVPVITSPATTSVRPPPPPSDPEVVLPPASPPPTIVPGSVR